ncbi:MAG: hypothetical protein GMKNLPBB_01823 [Myxococcota bacterium]|nr:hypothetical protein [Myxococcota bacterium]
MKSRLNQSILLALAVVCASAAAWIAPQAAWAQNCEKPNMLIVLDRSGSMNDYGKWDAARNAIYSLMGSHGAKIRWGLSMFPIGRSNCSTGQIDVDVGDNSSGAISSLLRSTSANGGGTPIGGALSSITGYWGINDPNRRNFVLLITDGMNNCSGSPSGAAAGLLGRGIKTYVVGFGSGVDGGELNRIAQAGGTGSYYRADNQAQLQTALNNIVVQATNEICDNKDNNCNGQVDEGLSQPCGNACGQGTQVCQNGQWGACNVQNPVAEVCDGKDNNCNGQIDEGLTRNCQTACGAGTQNCMSGEWGNCSAQQPEPEQCDGKDNDCNGKVDDITRSCNGKCGVGVETCSNGKWDQCSTDKIEPERCDGTDNDCNGKVDDGLAPRACSTACETGTEVCSQGSWVNCTARKPTNEVCDGKDNDCDGVIDEPEGLNEVNKDCQAPNTAGPCLKGLTKCTGGQVVCESLVKPAPETGDNKDNDCDGKVDDNLERECSTVCEKGVEKCEAGEWVNCSARRPTEELCNGVDDDCDGQVDDGDPEGGASCGTGQLGFCAAGILSCQGGIQVCAPNSQPRVESCNGLDDDCDGQVDEGDLKQGDRCPTGQPGRCAEGKTECSAGLINCKPVNDPATEVCNGLDDNCDGKVDEGVTNACGRCGAVPAETCNGKDDDCDGTVDEEAPCPSGQFCVEGACRNRCASGECPRGLSCETTKDGGKFCFSPCRDVACPIGQTCNDGTGKCEDLCKGACKEGVELCVKGQCVENDCYATGCPEGQVCVLGACKADECAGKKCAVVEFCRDGRCVPSCSRVSCALDERCEDGKCIKDPCLLVACNKGQRCKEGKCEGDPCEGVTCSEGRMCVEGSCTDDPCLKTQCAENEKCHRGQCLSILNPDQPVSPDGGSTDSDAASPDSAGGADGGSGDASAGAGNPPSETPPEEEENTESAGGGSDKTKRGAAAADAPGGMPVQPGCGCAAAPSRHPGSAAWLGLLTLLLVLRSYRKRTGF